MIGATGNVRVYLACGVTDSHSYWWTQATGTQLETSREGRCRVIRAVTRLMAGEMEATVVQQKEAKVIGHFS